MTQLEKAREIADKISKIGNGDRDGNSDGNRLGQQLRDIIDSIIAEERAEPAKPEPGEDVTCALRTKAESEFDDYRDKPQDYEDICPKYGQGDTALQARAFIDGYMRAAEVQRKIEEASNAD
jgi:hypothetical protein